MTWVGLGALALAVTSAAALGWVMRGLTVAAEREAARNLAYAASLVLNSNVHGKHALAASVEQWEYATGKKAA